MPFGGRAIVVLAACSGRRSRSSEPASFPPRRGRGREQTDREPLVPGDAERDRRMLPPELQREAQRRVDREICRESLRGPEPSLRRDREGDRGRAVEHDLDCLHRHAWHADRVVRRVDAGANRLTLSEVRRRILERATKEPRIWRNSAAPPNCSLQRQARRAARSPRRSLRPTIRQEPRASRTLIHGAAPRSGPSGRR